jgi:hypothetical protein
MHNAGDWPGRIDPVARVITMYDRLLLEGGKIAFDIIKNSESVVKLGDSPCTSAIPSASSLEQLNGWRRGFVDLAKLNTHEVLAYRPSGFGAPALRVEIVLAWLYNGKFKGDGNYIANATVYSKVLLCDDGVSLDLSVRFGAPFNAAGQNEQAKARLPFIVTAHIVQKLLIHKFFEGTYVWRGEIGGEPGDGDVSGDARGFQPCGFFSCKGEWIHSKRYPLLGINL